MLSSTMFRALKSLPRTVWVIGLISLINDSASEMVYPLIPLYLSSVLMAGPRVLGLIEGAAEAAASLLKLVSGVIVDRTRRRKPWIVLGYGIASFGRPLIALISNWPGLLVIRVADRIGKGLRTSPRDALLAASVSAEHRGLAFGVHRALDNAGAVVGPLLAFLLLQQGWPLRTIFYWTALPAVLCVGLALAMTETKPNEPAVAATAGRWRWTDMAPTFRRFLVVVLLFSLGNSSNMFLLLRARELGVPQAWIPLLWAAVSTVAMTFSTPFSAWSDRIGRYRLLLAGYAAYAVFYVLMARIAHANWTLVALFAFYGLFVAATEGVEKALVADLAPSDARGTAYGWFNLTTGVALLPASALFGWLYQALSPATAFHFSASCAAVAAVLLWFWVRPRNR
jgi:MFS family permease